MQQEFDTELWTEPLPPPRDVLLKKVRGCHGLLTMLSENIDAELFDAAGDQLKVVSQYAVGVNNIDLEEAAKRGIAVGNTPGVLTDATADLAFALLITAARRIVEAHQFIHAGEWKTWEPLGHIGWDLTDKTIGIVGMGRIGYAMAKRCYGGWGMNVLYTSRTEKPDANQNLQAQRVSFEELLKRSDFISVHTDLNEETKGMFNAVTFEKMKSDAIFINTARGGIHVQSDLVRALATGQIGAAGLDVTDPEPPDLSDPILQLPNCVIAPHIGSATTKTRNEMAKIATENLINALQGKPLRCEVK